MNQDVTIGAWRHGLEKPLLGQIEYVDKRREQGHRLLPFESTVSELSLILDAYDDLFEELLTAEPACCELVEEVHTESKPRKK